MSLGKETSRNNKNKVDKMTSQLAQKVFRFLRSEDGPAAVEYALMLSLIVLAAITGIVTLGQSTAVSVENLAEDMSGR